MKKTNLLFKVILVLICFSASISSNAQTTLAEWTFDNAYDQTGSGPFTYTPNATARTAADGLNTDVGSGDLFYPNSNEGTLADYEMSIVPGSGAIIKETSQSGTLYHASARMQGVVQAADFTDPANHANYYQFSFPTTGYYGISLDISMTTQNDADDYLEVVYSTDGGTTWATAGQALGHCCWWQVVSRSIDIVAKNKSNVVVRLIGVQGGATTGNYFFLNSIAISGTSTTLPPDTQSTITWILDEGSAAQTSSFSSGTDAFFRPDDLTVGSNLFFYAGGNPAGIRTSNGGTFTCWETNGKIDNIGPESAVSFVIEPVAGLTFVPTTISLDAQRYGTGNGLLGIEWVNADGTTSVTTAQATARDSDGVISSLTFDVSTSGITATSGASTLKIYLYSLQELKQFGLANIQIDGILNGTVSDVSTYTVTTASSPTDGGMVISDNPATVDEGTVVKLTANPNFGYEFTEWQIGGGGTSTEHPIFVTVTDDITYTAVFSPVATYALNVTVLGGANDYMVTALQNENNWMYEAGDVVTITARQNSVYTVSEWSTGETTASIDVTISGTTNISVSYTTLDDVIVGWDFYKSATNDLEAAFASDDNQAVLFQKLKVTDGSSASWLNFSTESGNTWGTPKKNCAINWSGTVGEHYYQIGFDASNFTDMSVQAEMNGQNYSFYEIQNCEYSLNGTDWNLLGTYTLSANWDAQSFIIPGDANNVSTVYVRWIADTGSTLTTNGNDATAITEIYVTGTRSNTITWNGSLSSDWGNAANWDGGVVPTSVDDVSIPDVVTDPVISDDAAVNNIEIVSGATVTVNSGASLAIMGDATGTGQLTVIRNTTGNGGYSIVGSPVAGADLSDLNANFLYTYDEFDGSWDVPTGGMGSGVGYFAGYDVSNPVVSLTGAAVSGTKAVGITKSGEGWNLVANPYAAAISISSFLSNTTNLASTTGSVYLWNDGGQNNGLDRAGDYVTVNDAGTVGSNDLGDGIAGQNTTAANVNIGSSQGFFVKANNAGNVQFTPGMQVTTVGANSDDNYYRKANSEKKLVKLSISGNGLFNETLVALVEGATLGLDYSLDAEKFSGNEFISFYSMMEDQKLAIQGLPQVGAEPINVQLGMDLKEAGEYKLTVEQFAGFSDSESVTLLDKLTGKSYDLTTDVSTPFTTDAVVNSKRFQLILAPAKVLSFDDQLNRKLQIFGGHSDLTIKYQSIRPENVSIYSLDGKVVFNRVVSFTKNQAVIDAEINTNQIYLLKVNNDVIKFILN